MSDDLELFPFDIQVLAFNRPQYLEKCLKALKSQTLPIDPKRIFFWQDGYSGSKADYLGLPDKTSKSLELIKRYFPESETFVSVKNVGIGLNYKAAEENAFVRHNNEWGFFLEEDNILEDCYLKLILQLVEKVKSFDEIVQVDAFGDYHNQPTEEYLISRHSWAFALRSKHYFERKELLSGYEEILRDHSYFRRDNARIYEYFSNYGLEVFGTTQDTIKRFLMLHFKRIALTTNFSSAKNIGASGEHFTPELYNQLGYQFQKTTVELKPLPPITEKTIMSLVWNQLRNLSAGFRITKSSWESEFRITKSSWESERDALVRERDALVRERDAFLSSTTWKYTKWLREGITEAKKFLFN